MSLTVVLRRTRPRAALGTWVRGCAGGADSTVAGLKSEKRKVAAGKKNYLAVTPDRRDEREFASLLSPDDYKFLCETTIYEKSQLKERARTQKTLAGRDKKVSLWNYLQTYRNRGYAEKYLLMDPVLGDSIGDAIVENSDALAVGAERGEGGTAAAKATFIDTDGGFCHVAKRVLEHQPGQDGGDSGGCGRAKRAFDKVKVYFRDYNLSLLHNRAVGTALSGHGPHRLEFRDVNLSTMSSDFFTPEFESPLTQELSVDGRHDWTASRPPFTIFGTVTDGFVKYLTFRLSDRQSANCEYHWCRPEFFFIVSHRTYSHMNCHLKDAGKRPTPKTVTAGFSPGETRWRPFDRLFRITFDSMLVDKLPLSSFFPWKESKRRQKVQRPDEEFLYLVKMRPKADDGISANATLVELSFYCDMLYRNAGATNATRVIPLAEKWLPGVGADMVRAGYDVYDTAAHMKEADLLRTFNVLADHPDFRQSAFPELAANYMEQKKEVQRANQTRTTHAVEETLINLRRKSVFSRKDS